MSRWVDVATASGVLGVSVYTLKRRAKLGQIPARQEPTSRGFKWYVELPDELTPSSSEASNGTHYLEELVSTLREENAWFKSELERRARETAELHILLQQEQQHRQRLLTVAQAIETATQPATQTGGQQVSRKPWWRFWVRA